MDTASFCDSVRDEAGGWDRAGTLPAEVVTTMAGAGFLSADLPVRYGGTARTQAELGELCARLGGVCSALRALATVQGMVAAAVLRWGTPEQRDRWLPGLARGEPVAGFAATEAGAGSDLSAVTSALEVAPGGFRLRGQKLWVTFGQCAGVFLVLAMLDGQPVAVLVEADRPGVEVCPVGGQLGLRAAGLADVRFDGVPVPAENLLAPPGFGLSHVTGTALDHGRYTVAWGCVGMAETCLGLAAGHAARRTQGGVRLSGHQAVRALLGRCLAEAGAARRACAHAAAVRDFAEPDAVVQTVLAKYTAARAASAVSEAAVQIHGAAGCAADSPVGRFFRDARVMRIIEGSDEVAEQHLGDYALRRRT
ncbi:MAG TPA: acyl-CoA dehydrogenase family protein [Actinophytocola sp.]|uniref:acyl-CoA dehydrogenase family protein n=1 Tax=Actinophytocola sp. TaxID=1872138 RepID=UPI002DB6E499|nr:acyl-CoA dehydrogenase family protein [Actinophytocola sp.]HEU5470741.1 acyl-CoA dehydrogenase family protein [Actinophytocola sp.]